MKMTFIYIKTSLSWYSRINYIFYRSKLIYAGISPPWQQDSLHLHCRLNSQLRVFKQDIQRLDIETSERFGLRWLCTCNYGDHLQQSNG